MIKCGNSVKCFPPSEFSAETPWLKWSRVVDSLFRTILNDDSPGEKSVYIRDIDSTRKKLYSMICSGSHALQVVSDFDRTLSKYKHNGHVTPTCHGIFEMDPELTESVKSKLKFLRDKYYPIEIDHNLSDAEKSPHMVEWWNISHETIVSCGLHHDALVKTVRDCGLVLREGVRDFMDLLHDQNIPVLIFSAGLGDVIELLLENFNLYKENIRVVSNFMKFNDEGLLVGFSEPIIHTFNKTAASIMNGDYSEVSLKRPCVLLLGDSTGDVHMADGATMDDPEGILGTVLRIGFLNDSIETNLEKYKNIYDIVLVNDDSFTVPLTIVQCILQCHQTYAASSDCGANIGIE